MHQQLLIDGLHLMILPVKQTTESFVSISNCFTLILKHSYESFSFSFPTDGYGTQPYTPASVDQWSSSTDIPCKKRLNLSLFLSLSLFQPSTKAFA